MDAPSFLEPQMNIRVCRSVEESAVQPKFTFVVGDEVVGDFSLTRRCLYVLRFCIEREACSCVLFMSQLSDEFWESMASVSRERFWFRDAPSTSSLFSPTFEIPECDSELCFETMGLMMLNIMPGRSFLHIHSGTGYACTIAASYLGPRGTNHGVEFRTEQRAKAKENLEHLLRMDPPVDRDNSLPAYHARFPGDLLSGRVKFDRILINDCFRTLEEVLSLRDMLKRGGFLVTGFAGEIYDEPRVGMIVLLKDDFQEDRIFEIHPFEEGRFHQIVLHPLIAQNNTLERLREARANPEDQPLDRGAPSLRTLALRLFYKRTEPPGDPRYVLVVRPPARLHLLPNLSVHLAHVTAAFRNFRIECLSSAENFLGPSGHLAAVNELAGLTLALEGLGKEFLGPQNFQRWKTGEAVQLSVPQGVMAWLLENIFHLMHFSGVRSFESALFGSDVLNDESCGAVKQFLLLGFLFFFHRIDHQVLAEHRPWSFQLSQETRMLRTLTRLAARFWVDACWLVGIVRAMKTAFETAYGQPLPADADINFNLLRFQWLLVFLSKRVLRHGDSFTSLEAVQDCFQSLKSHMWRIHSDAHSILEASAGITEVQQFFCCFCIVFSSALRNLVLSGRPRGTTNAAQQHFVMPRGGLVDRFIFQAEIDSLSTSALQGAVSIEDISAFLVRRFLSDFKEVLWMAQSGDKERHLAVMEDNKRLYHFNVLEPHLPVPYIDSLLRAIERREMTE